MLLNRKLVLVLSLALLVIGLRFILEAAFPDLSEMFCETNTVAGVIALFVVAIGWKVIGSKAGEADSHD